MTGDLTKFTSLKLKAEGHVSYGDNNRGRIMGRCTVGTGNSTTIENVLYVEVLKHSLLSINQLCDKGYKVNFKSNDYTISSDPSGLPKEWKTPRDLTLDNVIGNIEKGDDTIVVQIYVDDIIFGSNNGELCETFVEIMKSEFEMSMIGELNYFLGLQVKQLKEGIFLNQSIARIC